MQPVTVTYNNYLFTTDKLQMQPEVIHKWLSETSYWSQHIPFNLVKLAFDNSFCIGILKDNAQVGYARLITDYTTFGYLADVYVLEEHRGQGLSKKMMEILLGLDWVRTLRRIMLATRDAHGLYEQYGFTELKTPEKLMEISRPTIYEKQTDNPTEKPHNT